MMINFYGQCQSQYLTFGLTDEIHKDKDLDRDNKIKAFREDQHILGSKNFQHEGQHFYEFFQDNKTILNLAINIKQDDASENYKKLLISQIEDENLPIFQIQNWPVTNNRDQQNQMKLLIQQIEKGQFESELIEKYEKKIQDYFDEFYEVFDGNLDTIQDQSIQKITKKIKKIYKEMKIEEFKELLKISDLRKNLKEYFDKNEDSKDNLLNFLNKFFSEIYGSGNIYIRFKLIQEKLQFIEDIYKEINKKLNQIFEPLKKLKFNTKQYVYHDKNINFTVANFNNINGQQENFITFNHGIISPTKSIIFKYFNKVENNLNIQGQGQKNISLFGNNQQQQNQNCNQNQGQPQLFANNQQQKQCLFQKGPINNQQQNTGLFQQEPQQNLFQKNIQNNQQISQIDQNQKEERQSSGLFSQNNNSVQQKDKNLSHSPKEKEKNRKTRSIQNDFQSTNYILNNQKKLMENKSVDKINQLIMNIEIQNNLNDLDQNVRQVYSDIIKNDKIYKFEITIWYEAGHFNDFLLGFTLLDDESKNNKYVYSKIFEWQNYFFLQQDKSLIDIDILNSTNQVNNLFGQNQCKKNLVMNKTKIIIIIDYQKSQFIAQDDDGRIMTQQTIHSTKKNENRLGIYCNISKQTEVKVDFKLQQKSYTKIN
ncbi:hypothetical protein PPERSA_02289 [Pseudocohnilembus persalinus]|uniref:Uncharacterized protein n=1 Tax=Pseudocohnilembus persalinus TaxID=266149 RepID=A0A0V0QHK9_PSEPJ|nr:hypothetical protein PPERSA_02289 [Pseudocohnilembus persalinus]|eukprot:KRX01761.1 hypothetical protein PPERSA_02289 [Pseudocohnilembus persalinus]